LADIGKLTALLELQTKQYGAMMKKAQKQTDQSFKAMDKSANLFRKSLKGITALMSGVAVGALLKSSVDKMRRQTAVVKMLQVAIEQQGGSWIDIMDDVLAQMDMLEKKTGFLSTDIIEAVAVSINAGADYRKMLKHVELGLDITAAHGEDLFQTMRDLGRLFAGDVMSFAELFPEVGLLGEAETKVENVLEILERLSKGQASEIFKSENAQLKTMSNNLTEIQEIGGEVFLMLASPGIDAGLPLLRKYADTLRSIFSPMMNRRELISALEEVKNGERELVKGTQLFRFAKASLDDFGNAAKEARDKYAEMVSARKIPFAPVKFFEEKALKIASDEALRLTTQYDNLINALNNVKPAAEAYTGFIDKINISQAEINKAIAAGSEVTEEFLENIAKIAAGPGFELSRELLEIPSEFSDGIVRVVDDLTTMEEVGVNVAHTLAGAFASFIADTDRDFAEFAKNLSSQIAGIILQAAILAGLSTAFKASGIGFLLKIGTFLSNAQGNVFANGRVQEFAQGGVVYSPTVFPMRNGAGLMGEAGPEAVMPLTRMSGGDLGVKAETPVVELNPHFDVSIGGEEVHAVIKRLDRFDSERGVR